MLASTEETTRQLKVVAINARGGLSDVDAVSHFVQTVNSIQPHWAVIGVLEADFVQDESECMCKFGQRAYFRYYYLVQVQERFW